MPMLSLKSAPRPVWLLALAVIALLAFAACGGDGEEQTLEIAMIPTIQFDKAELTVQADGSVTVAADNTDTDIPHNFAVYTDESAQDLIAKTETCDGPCEDSVTFDIPEPGEYFFQCDVHPDQMVGTFIVE
jgi:plastocyanin